MAKAKRAAPKRRKKKAQGPQGFLSALASTLEHIEKELHRRRGETHTVLIAEDDDDAREILATVLTHAGYATVTASNGLEALSLLKRVIPSLIILDLRMPEMDGWALDREIKLDPRLRKIPVVVVSAFAKLDTARSGIEADAWLQKPVDLDALLELLPKLTDAASDTTMVNA